MKPKFKVFVGMSLGGKDGIHLFAKFNAQNSAAQDYLEDELGTKGTGETPKYAHIRGEKPAANFYRQLINDGCEVESENL